MAGKDSDDYRPRRARAESPEEPDAESVGRTPSTEETIARARHAERVDELRKQREGGGFGALPSKADRPDVGRRRNVNLDRRRNVNLDETGGRSGRRAPVIIVVAALLAAAVAVTAILLTANRRTPVANPGQTPPPSVPVQMTMVGPDTMLSGDDAKMIDDQDWKVGADDPGDADGVASPACLASPPKEAPAPANSLVRTLTTDGGPSALHRAEAYETAELATEAFALIAKSLGECNLKGSYITEGRVITGLGDQATGVLLEDAAQNSRRAVVVNRTGRVVNVIDVANIGSTPDIRRVAEALGQVTNSQCTIAVGICATGLSVKKGPPPIGGDEPGFLALADLPLPTTGKGTWGGLPPGPPEVIGSGCENVDFNELDAENRIARSYVLTDSPDGMPDTFGLDQITLSMASEEAAADLAELIVDYIDECDTRLPTADVKGVSKVSGVGAGGTEVSGSVAVVDQQVGDEDDIATYRVGVVAAGSKLVYTFLAAEDDWDFTKLQWIRVTLRAAERATQVR